MFPDIIPDDDCTVQKTSWNDYTIESAVIHYKIIGGWYLEQINWESLEVCAQISKLGSEPGTPANDFFRQLIIALNFTYYSTA